MEPGQSLRLLDRLDRLVESRRNPRFLLPRSVVAVWSIEWAACRYSCRRLPSGIGSLVIGFRGGEGALTVVTVSSAERARISACSMAAAPGPDIGQTIC